MRPSSPSCHIPSLPSAVVRERWLDLLDRAYATRQVTQAGIEPGVTAVVAAPAGPAGDEATGLERIARAEFLRLPVMARGFRLQFDKIQHYGLPLEDNFGRWLGKFSPDVLCGRTDVVAFVDLAYLEAAILDQLYPLEVLVDFRVPLAFFTRGGLVDGANVLEAAAVMVFEGRSLMDAAARLARKTLSHLEAYATAFWKLSRLYADFQWRIERDNFILDVPGKNLALTFHYSDLRSGEARAFEGWQRQIENLRREANPFSGSNPKSFAA